MGASLPSCDCAEFVLFDREEVSSPDDDSNVPVEAPLQKMARLMSGRPMS